MALRTRKRTTFNLDDAANAGELLTVLVPRGGCLDWPGLTAGRTGGSMYGRVAVKGRGYMYVHRLICEWAHGPAPDGKPWVLHSCDRAICCNPAHLRWGSPTENIEDAVRTGRRQGWRAGRTTKMTHEDAERIRVLVQAGARQVDTAQEYGVSESTVSLIVNGKRWKQ